MNVSEQYKKTNDSVVEKRRALHEIAEVGGVLPKSSEYIMAKLREMEIPYRKNSSDDGVVALIEGKNKDKVVALRADFDALPIVEETGLSFASKSGAMHACGHDAHGAILLEVAQILSAKKDQLNGSVKLVFQTEEEGVLGAARMIEEGALENPKVDAILGLHTGVILGDQLEHGQIAIVPGTIMASSDKFIVTVTGRGGHASTPWLCINPNLIAVEIIQTLHEEVHPSREEGVITVTRIEAGNSYNIIPDQTVFYGTIRAHSLEKRTFLHNKLKEVAEKIVSKAGAKVDVEIMMGPPPVVNHPEVCKVAAEAIIKTLGEDAVKTQGILPTTVAEDMAYYLEKVPGLFMLLDTKINAYPHHNSKFDIDESILWRGVAALAQTTFELLK